MSNEPDKRTFLLPIRDTTSSLGRPILNPLAGNAHRAASSPPTFHALPPPALHSSEHFPPGPIDFSTLREFQAFGCQGIVDGHQCPNAINAYETSTCGMHGSMPQTPEHRDWLYVTSALPPMPRPDILWRQGFDPRSLTVPDFCRFMRYIVGGYKSDDRGNPDLPLMYILFENWARHARDPNARHYSNMDDLSTALASWQGPQANTRPNVVDDMTTAFQSWQGPSQ